MTSLIKAFISPFTFFWDIKNYILAALLAGYAGYFIGHYAGVLDAGTKTAIKQVSTDILIEEKQDEIRNNRPDRSGTAKRLYRGTF